MKILQVAFLLLFNYFYYSDNNNFVVPDFNECSSSPCKHGGSCSEAEIDFYSCDCQPGFTGTRCEISEYTNIIHNFYSLYSFCFIPAS